MRSSTKAADAATCSSSLCNIRTVKTYLPQARQVMIVVEQTRTRGLVPDLAARSKSLASRIESPSRSNASSKTSRILGNWPAWNSSVDNHLHAWIVSRRASAAPSAPIHHIVDGSKTKVAPCRQSPRLPPWPRPSRPMQPASVVGMAAPQPVGIARTRARSDQFRPQLAACGG